METDRLRYFSTIAKTGSLSKAAKILHVTPAALSKAMKVLEEELDTKLLLPAGRGIVLSEDGKRIAREAVTLLERLDSLKSPEKKTGVSAIRLVSFEVFTTYFLSGALQDEFSEYGLEVLDLLPGQIEEAIATDRSDLGVTYLPIPHPEIEFTQCAQISMGVYGLERFKGCSFDELPFVIPLAPIHGSPSKVRGLDGWPDHTKPRHIRYRVSLLQTALELMRRGLAVGYIPTFLVSYFNDSVRAQYRLVELHSPIPKTQRNQPVYLVRRRNAEESTLDRKLAKCLGRLK